MSQSLTKTLIHLVFSTKDRCLLIEPSIREDLHDYAGGALRKLDSPAIEINSVSDHIHVLFNLHKTKSVSEVVMELKRSTSIWMKEQGPRFDSFYWQAGYGAFSVSQSAVENVRAYIVDQESHHAKKSFQTEFRSLLVRHEVEFDERYVWD